jgi:hypothetical protein
MSYDGNGMAELLARVLKACPAPTPIANPAATKRSEMMSKAWTAPGILGTSRVETQFGLVPAQLVRVGDMLRTRDGSFLRVLRISDLKIDQAYLDVRPEAAPVIIKKNTLPRRRPIQDLGLSPAHMVAIGPNRFEEEMVVARDLSSVRGRVDRSLGMLLYVQFHFELEAIIKCEGMWVLSGVE